MNNSGLQIEDTAMPRFQRASRLRGRYYDGRPERHEGIRRREERTRNGVGERSWEQMTIRRSSRKVNERIEDLCEVKQDPRGRKEACQ